MPYLAVRDIDIFFRTEREPERPCLRSLAQGVICAGSPTFWNRHLTKSFDRTCVRPTRARAYVEAKQGVMSDQMLAVPLAMLGLEL